MGEDQTDDYPASFNSSVNLFEGISKEQKERYDESLQRFKLQFNNTICRAFNEYFSYSNNNMVFISKDIENPDYEYYDQILEETRRKISAEYNVKNVPLIPILVFPNENYVDSSFFNVYKDNLIFVSKDCFNVQNLTDKFIPFLRLKDISHELSINDTEYKNASEDEQKAYEKRLENIKNYFKDQTGREFDDVFYCSNDSTLIISKEILDPDCKFYFDKIAESKNLLNQLIPGMHSKSLIPIIITGNLNSDQNWLRDKIANAAYYPLYEFISCNSCNLCLDTIAHELVHAQSHAQLKPEAFKSLPNWLNEGLTTQAESKAYLGYSSEFEQLTPENLFDDSFYNVDTVGFNTFCEFYAINYLLIRQWKHVNGDTLPIEQMIEEINNKVDDGTFKPSDFKDFFMAHNGDLAVESLKNMACFNKEDPQ